MICQEAFKVQQYFKTITVPSKSYSLAAMTLSVAFRWSIAGLVTSLQLAGIAGMPFRTIPLQTVPNGMHYYRFGDMTKYRKTTSMRRVQMLL